MKTKPMGWRRGWDSNPRLSFPNTRFPSVLLKPLGHLSGVWNLSVTNQRASGKHARSGEIAGARFRKCLLHFLRYSGVVQSVARQPLELVILVRVQAPEPSSEDVCHLGWVGPTTASPLGQAA